MKNNQLLKRIALVAAGFILSVPMLFSQSKITVTGTVTDVDKEPLIGVAVMLPGTHTGTSTDIDGNFTLEVTEGEMLEFSSIGFETIQLKAEKTMDVTLREDSQLLEETVVVGYGVQKKESLTSAITQIAAEDIASTKTDNAVMALQGKVPGLLIRENTGKPGSFDADLSLRGYGQPMIVVDGVVRSATMYRRQRSWNQDITSMEAYNDISVLNELNPDDIESISVLKDASATIYGLGAQNGVILITTKKGRVQKPSVNLSASVALTKPTLIRDVVDWNDFMLWDNQMADVAYGVGQGHRWTEDQINGYKIGDPNYIYTDWVDECYKEFAVNSNYNVSVNGGTETVNYYVGAGYTENNSILDTDGYGYERYNFSATVNVKLSDALSVRYNTSFRQSTTRQLPNTDDDNNIFYYMLQSNPTVGVHTKDNPNHYSDVEEHTNPVALLDTELSGYSKQDMKTYNNTVDFTYDAPFLKGLKFTATGAFDYTRNKVRSLSKHYSLYDYATDQWAAYSRFESGYSELWAENQRIYGRIQAAYDKSIDGVHNISAMLGAETTNTKSAQVNAFRKYGEGFEDAFYTHDTINSGLESSSTNTGTRSESATAGYIGRIAYNYKGKYLVEAMGRYDGSYVYAPGYRWGFFPSYTLGWRISEEPFFKNIFPNVNNLKFRWSDGKTGSIQSTAYEYLGGYSESGSWVFSEGAFVPGYQNTSVENTLLTWADVRMQDFGIDWEVWRGKFGGTFDWFRRTTTGIAGTRTADLPSFYGVDLPRENLNANENQGLELMISHRNNIGEFSYRISANATYTRSRKTFNLAETTTKYSSAMNYWKSRDIDRWNGYMGGSMYHWTGEQFTSLNDIADSNVLYNLNGKNGGNAALVPGQYALEDRDGDGYITGSDVYYTWGESNPPLQFGLNMNFSWKGLDLTLSFAGASLKRKELRLTAYAGFGKLNYLPTMYTDSYHVAEYGADPDDPNTEWVAGFWPALFRTSQVDTMLNSVYGASQPYNWINATFLRLKTVELGYRMNARFLNKVGIKSLRVYFNGTNILTFCNKLLKSVDPEAYDSGRQAGGYQPLNKSYTFGLNLNF